MRSFGISEKTRQVTIDRPTRDLILFAMFGDEISRNKRGVSKLAQALSLSKGAIGDQLKVLAQENPPLVQNKKRGHWELTESGREYVRPYYPVNLERNDQDNTLPFYGLIGAGDPILMANDPIDTFSFSNLNPNEYFVMQVRGDSMLNEHICDGDIVILRRVAGWDGWDNIRSGDIIAAAVPEGSNVHLPDWLDRILQAMEVGDFVSELNQDHVTLKKLDSRMKKLIGRYGAIKTAFKPIGILVEVHRTI